MIPAHWQMALTSRHWVIPVCYDGDFAPDIIEVADRCEMTAEEVISRHLAKSLGCDGIYARLRLSGKG